jgi:catechol 2,3-dioxygenase-like lactoylglutathione lyase family enzyme
MPDMATPQRPNAVLRPTDAPARLHHLAFMTFDTAATAKFYSEVLGMPLVNAVVDHEVPSTKAPYPYFHSFFRMATGETLAFFECPGIPKPGPKPHPAYDDFEHVAMQVPTRADVEEWRRWLESQGLEVIDADHGIIYSVYFRDPVNNIRLEITATLKADWNRQEASAASALEEWEAAKRQAAIDGRDVVEALRDFARKRSDHAKRLLIDG